MVLERFRPSICDIVVIAEPFGFGIITEASSDRLDFSIWKDGQISILKRSAFDSEVGRTEEDFTTFHDRFHSLDLSSALCAKRKRARKRLLQSEQIRLNRLHDATVSVRNSRALQTRFREDFEDIKWHFYKGQNDDSIINKHHTLPLMISVLYPSEKQKLLQRGKYGYREAVYVRTVYQHPDMIIAPENFTSYIADQLARISMKQRHRYLIIALNVNNHSISSLTGVLNVQ